MHIASALLLHSNLSNSHIHNAHSVDTQKLIVKDIAEFYSDVVIDGSVTIHGTVIGKCLNNDYLLFFMLQYVCT